MVARRGEGKPLRAPVYALLPFPPSRTTYASTWLAHFLNSKAVKKKRNPPFWLGKSYGKRHNFFNG